jgi:filamentous hemagglutinin
MPARAAPRRSPSASTAGTLVAGRALNDAAQDGQLSIDAAALSGDGQLLSHGDLAITLDAAYNHSGVLNATGNASLTTRDALTNTGTLQAGGTLSLRSRSLDNQASGEISATTTQLHADETLTNRGLIDGQHTRIDAATVNNLAGGRL